jgi:prevent-host-death family protein
MDDAARRVIPGRTVLKAAAFKAQALAVMRRVQETGRAVTITSRGKPMVRIEPVRARTPTKGHGCMKGTVHVLVPDRAFTASTSGRWDTLREWQHLERRDPR